MPDWKKRSDVETAEFERMMARCHDPLSLAFPLFGEQGIIVEWVSPRDMVEDIGLAPGGDHFVGRIDMQGNYSKENCIWRKLI